MRRPAGDGQQRLSSPTSGIRHDRRIDAIARQNGIDGVVILAVEPSGPADEAGLRPAQPSQNGGIVPGDVIQRVAAKLIASGDDLGAALNEHEAGDSVALLVWRNGETREVIVRLAAP
jgi:S1-C subfamily serine protease